MVLRLESRRSLESSTIVPSAVEARSPFPNSSGGLSLLIPKKSVSTVRPTIHTNPSPKRSFSQTLFKPEEFENTADFRFRVDGKHFENKALRDQIQ